MKRNNILMLSAVSAFVALLFAETKAVSAGVSQGLTLAGAVFIPAMLPFLFLAAFVTKSRAGSALAKTFAPACKRLGLPPESAPVIFMAFLGGYPAGAAAAGTLVKEGRMDKNSAATLLCFCVNAGPAFVIFSAGGVMLGSIQAGLILQLSLLTGALACAGIALRKPPPRARPRAMPGAGCARRPAAGGGTAVRGAGGSGLAAAFAESVTMAGKSCLTAAASIGFFSGILGAADSLMTKIGLSCPAASAFLRAATEITSGCAAVSETEGFFTLPAMAAALGFGSICVLVQILAFCDFLPVGRLLAYRLLHSAVAFCTAALLTLLIKPALSAPTAAETAALIGRTQSTAALAIIALAFVICAANLLQKEA